MKVGSGQFCLIIFVNFIIFLGGYGPLQVAQAQSVRGIVHFPEKTAVEGEAVRIEARLEDPNIQVQYFRLYYRQKGQSNFQHEEMVEQANGFFGEIPGSEVKSPAIEYFIMAVLRNQAMVTSPASNPYYAPYEIIVNPKVTSIGQQPTKETIPKSQKPPDASPTRSDEFQIIILSPEPNETLASNEVVIAASFVGNTKMLSLKSVRIYLDDQPVTSLAEITSNIVSFVPKNLGAGIHRVKITTKDKKGKPLDSKEWQFSVYSTRDPFQNRKQRSNFSGRIYAEWKNEHISDSTLSNQNIGGNIQGKFGPIEYRGMVYYTSRENPRFQPRNRLLLEAGTPWIGVKFGDTTPRFNELMLWGSRVRGIEAYLKLGLLNVEFAQGQLERPIEGQPMIAIASDSTRWIHPVSGDTVRSTTGIYRYGTYDRRVLAIRPSFGGGKYFQLGLNLVKVKDDPQSVRYSTQPKDNIVFGPDLLLAFDNHRIELKASAAFSLLANDISEGAMSQADLDSAFGEIPFDPSQFEQYFVLNTSLIPLDPSQLTSLAYQASFKFNYFGQNIYAVYKSVGAEFYALANNYIRKDIQGFSIYDRIRLYRNQVFLNLGYEKYQEGRSYQDDGEPSTAPTELSVMNIGISVYPRAKYLPKLMLNWKNLSRDNGLDTTITTRAINYQNRDISLQVAYDLPLLGVNHNISLSYITADRSDGFNRLGNTMANDIQMLSWRTNYQIPLTTVISYATNQNSAGAGLSDFKYRMFGIAADYKLLDRRLSLQAGWNTTSAVGTVTMDQDSLGNPLPRPISSDYTDHQRNALTIGAEYRPNHQHALLLDMSFIDFDDKITGHFQDRIFWVRYEFRYQR
ncbi:MAG: hypothetical protein ONB32_13050 [candidate division KSB1 bacterium]|nr:hypothetical protein [candidate division KSB1 bacterium]